MPAFQFQTVRLKGRAALRAAIASRVSIPNGSIKSGLPVCFKNLRRQVSIPNGSIKRARNQLRLDLLAEFQFQTVRLKDGYLGKNGRRPPPFQFQTVRLKAGKRGWLAGAQSVFQFQTVRLKAKSINCNLPQRRSFNSKRFD